MHPSPDPERTTVHEAANHFRLASLRVPALLLLAGAACFTLFAALGHSVAPDGRLHEPFALLPLGWMFTAMGAFGLGVLGTIHLVKTIHQLRRQP